MNFHCQRIEKNVYNSAKSFDEYHKMLAEKIWKIQKQLDEQRQVIVDVLKDGDRNYVELKINFIFYDYDTVKYFQNPPNFDP